MGEIYLGILPCTLVFKGIDTAALVHEKLGIDLADTHLVTREGLALAEQLAILGSHVKAIHVQDNLGDDDFHLAPFFGTTNFDSVMKGLKDIDFKGYFTFEACSIPVSGYRRRKFEGSELLLNAPLSVKLKTEALIYEIGKAILEAYDCFEE